MGDRKFIDVIAVNGFGTATLDWCVVMITLPRKEDDADDEHRLTFAVVRRGTRIRFPFCVCSEWGTREKAAEDLEQCKQEFLQQ